MTSALVDGLVRRVVIVNLLLIGKSGQIDFLGALTESLKCFHVRGTMSGRLCIMHYGSLAYEEPIRKHKCS